MRLNYFLRFVKYIHVPKLSFCVRWLISHRPVCVVCTLYMYMDVHVQVDILVLMKSHVHNFVGH